MTGTTFQRCVTCRRNTNGEARQRTHAASGCTESRRRWGYSFRMPPDASGRRKLRTVTTFATQREAQQALRQQLTSIDRGEFVEPVKLSVNGYLTEWLATTEPPATVFSTFQKRQLHVRYTTDALGGRMLQTISANDLDRFYGDLRRGGGRGGRPLSATTVRDVHRTLHKAFSDAVRWQRMERNPCDRAAPPKMGDVNANARAGRQVWTVSELRQFLAATEHHRFHPVFHLALATGMRAGEYLGLPWAAVDFEGGSLRVGQVLAKTEAGYQLRDRTKTLAGLRTVYLDPQTLSMLADLRRQRSVLRLAGDDLVFCNQEGAPLSPKAVSMAFGRACIDAGVTRIRLHDARHTHASLLLLEQGTDVAAVSERLGHSSVAVTMGLYAHAVAGRQKLAAESFGRMLAG